MSRETMPARTDFEAFAHDALVACLRNASVQRFGDDAALRTIVADMMTEHLDISTDPPLLALADVTGKPEPQMQPEESLREEDAIVASYDRTSTP